MEIVVAHRAFNTAIKSREFVYRLLALGSWLVRNNLLSRPSIFIIREFFFIE